LDRFLLPLHCSLDVPEECRIATPLSKLTGQGLDLLHHSLDDESPRRSKVFPPTRPLVPGPEVERRGPQSPIRQGGFAQVGENRRSRSRRPRLMVGWEVRRPSRCPAGTPGRWERGDEPSPVPVLLDHVLHGIRHGPLVSQIQRAVLPLVIICEEAPGDQLHHDIVRPLLDFPLVTVARISHGRGDVADPVEASHSFHSSTVFRR